MKKLLLGSAAVVLGLGFAAPAHADGVELDLGGYFKGYGVYVDQDDSAAVAGEAREFDMIRDTEIHASGEYTLDNGLTVGAHIEADVDGGDSFAVDESYAYFSGAWGRVNAGIEDGAAYLLQVAAPSADSNYDGIRQYVQPFNYTAAGVAAVAGGLDYDNDLTTGADKLTYLSPVFNGFQAGASYTFDVQDFGAFTSNGMAGVGTDDVAGLFGEAYEIAARYEGQFDAVGFAIGAGWTDVQLEDDAAGEDDFNEWNIGLDMDWGAFGFGAIYTENNNGQDANDEDETWVVGVDYTTGPYKLGASYLTNEDDATGTTVETDRWTAGAVYTYGPGMTFRGSISHVQAEQGAAEVDGTAVLLGTQINF